MVDLLFLTLWGFHNHIWYIIYGLLKYPLDNKMNQPTCIVSAVGHSHAENGVWP